MFILKMNMADFQDVNLLRSSNQALETEVRRLKSDIEDKDIELARLRKLERASYSGGKPKRPRPSDP